MDSYEKSIIENIGTAHFSEIIESEYSALANIVASTEDEIIGYARISNLSPFSNFQTLEELFVHPNYIRRGVGSKLLQTLATNSASRGCQLIKLYSSITAEPFYHVNGYQTLEKTFIHGHSMSIPVVHMEKELVESSTINNPFEDLSQQIFVRNFFENND